MRAQQPLKHHMYKAIDVGTFGGPNSEFSSPNHGLTPLGALIGGAGNSSDGIDDSVLRGADNPSASIDAKWKAIAPTGQHT